MQRIVSLIASATEIVCALGCGDRLMARSHECDFPDFVHALPVCTGPKFDVSGSSLEIDRRVKATLQDSLSVYHVDRELLRRLEPDVIITQAQCDVCAVNLRDVEEAIGDWLGARPRVVSLLPNTLADVRDDILRVADALELPGRGRELVGEMDRRLAGIGERARAAGKRPSVLFVEWIEPLMAGGNWMPELIEIAGGVNIAGETGKHSPWTEWEQVRQLDPEVIVVAPCGFDIARTRQELPALVSLPGWNRLRAVSTGRVFVADGNQYFNRPGPRLVESTEILAELIHPATFPEKHRSTGWQPAV